MMDFTSNENLLRVKLFADARHRAAMRKLNNAPFFSDSILGSYKFTNDSILGSYKFTNVFRLMDRTTQGVIRIINDSKDDTDQILAQRIYIYKMFNSVHTWKRLPQKYKEAPLLHVDEMQRWSKEEAEDGRPVFSRAYLLCTGQPWLPLYMSSFRELFNSDDVHTLVHSDNVEDRYKVMIHYPGFGEFLAYQFALDFSYIHCRVNAYNEFVVPGPGCMRGMKKVFGTTNKKEAAAICQNLAVQDYFELSYDDHSLLGNDVQNIFCEFDKYSRARYPDMHYDGALHRIKSKYVPNHETYTVEWPDGWIY